MKAVEPVVAHLSGGAAPALRDNAVFAADQSVAIPQCAAVLRLVQREDLFDVLAHIPQEPPNPEAPTFLPSLSPTASVERVGFDGFEVRESQPTANRTTARS